MVDSALRTDLGRTKVYDLELWRQYHTCEDCGIFDSLVEYDEWAEQLLCPPCHAKMLIKKAQLDEQRCRARAEAIGCSYELMRFLEGQEKTINYLRHRIRKLEEG